MYPARKLHVKPFYRVSSKTGHCLCFFSFSTQFCRIFTTISNFLTIVVVQRENAVSDENRKLLDSGLLMKEQFWWALGPIRLHRKQPQICGQFQLALLHAVQLLHPTTNLHRKKWRKDFDGSVSLRFGSKSQLFDIFLKMQLLLTTRSLAVAAVLIPPLRAPLCEPMKLQGGTYRLQLISGENGRGLFFVPSRKKVDFLLLQIWSNVFVVN